MNEIFLLRRGGGAGLNFRIVGGTVQPESPRENTIWVNTDTAVTGWALSHAEPAAPAEGMVWVQLGTDSDYGFNALKKNELLLFPQSVRQYVNSAWVEKEGAIYQNAAWLGLFSGLYLYRDGDLCTAASGGWSYSGSAFAAASNSGGALVFEADEAFATKRKLSRGDYTKLCVLVSAKSGSGNTLVLTSTRHDYDEGQYLAARDITKTGLITLEIEKLTASFYVELYAYGESSMRVTKIWME